MFAPLIPVLCLSLFVFPQSAENAPAAKKSEPPAKPAASQPAKDAAKPAAPKQDATPKRETSAPRPDAPAKRDTPGGTKPDAAPSGNPEPGKSAPPPAASPSGPPASQPASAPSEPPATSRLPQQAEIFKALIERNDAVKPIEPMRPDGAKAATQAADAKSVMLEGEQIVNREARLVRGGARPEFLIQPKEGGSAQSFPILESQLLEVVEREAETGVDEFLITAEAKLYRGRNYLLLLKVVRRVPNGNVAP